MYSEASTYVELFSFFGSHRFSPLKVKILMTTCRFLGQFIRKYTKFMILLSGMGSPRAVDVWLLKMSTTCCSYAMSVSTTDDEQMLSFCLGMK